MHTRHMHSTHKTHMCKHICMHTYKTHTRHMHTNTHTCKPLHIRHIHANTHSHKTHTCKHMHKTHIHASTHICKCTCKHKYTCEQARANTQTRSCFLPLRTRPWGARAVKGSAPEAGFSPAQGTPPSSQDGSHEQLHTAADRKGVCSILA